jgi:segregation and condensation protein B
MSARKGKKPVVRKKSAADGGTAGADLEVVSPSNGAGAEQLEDADAGGSDSDSDSREPAAESPAEADAAPSEPAPVISSINELRPRSAGDPPADEEAESALAAGDVDDDELSEAAPPAAAPTTRAHLKRVIESLIFVSDQIITALQLARIVKAKVAEIRELIAEIMVDYDGRGIELIEVAGGYQFRSAAASAPFVRDLVSQRPVRLTRAQLETLALIAYRQPITRPEIDDVRGVDSGSAIKVLLERDLIKILGRKDEAGRPLLYGTSAYFLEFFSMRTMQDLPTLREFTELNQEHRELFQRKTGEIPDLSTEAAPHVPSSSVDDEESDGEAVAPGPPETAEAADASGEADELADPTSADGDRVNESSDEPSQAAAEVAAEEHLGVGSFEPESVDPAQARADSEVDAGVTAEEHVGVGSFEPESIDPTHEPAESEVDA